MVVKLGSEVLWSALVPGYNLQSVRHLSGSICTLHSQAFVPPLKYFISTGGVQIKSNPNERHLKAFLKTLKRLFEIHHLLFSLMLTSVSKHQDGGMYKTPTYPGYPFLMLPDPYLPNGSVSPSVSTPVP